MVLNATFNNTSVISWRSVLLGRKLEYRYDHDQGSPHIILGTSQKCANGLLQSYIYHICRNCIGGVMVSVLASSAVDRGFEP